MNPQASIRIDTAASTGTAAFEELELAGYCGRPSCRAQFQQATGPGRRREYCSETCRRGADKDYKQAQAMVTHLTRLLERSQYDLAAFGRDDDEDGAVRTPAAEAHLVKKAYGAIQRAEAIVQFAAEPNDRWFCELRDLAAAVGPLLKS